MVIPTVIMAVLAIFLLAIGYSKGGGQHIRGLNSGLKMIVEIIPLLLFAFIVAGMIQVLVPQELLSRLIGEESGLKGIFIGTLAGGVTPGGRSGNHGGLPDGLVSLGSGKIAHGDRDSGLEIHFGPAGMHLFLPAYRGFDRSVRLLRD